MIPTSSNYPDEIDTNRNLYVVHDSLRLRLARDYNPGDQSIIVDGDAGLFAQFPSSGLITLTEQCTDPELRALCFFYNAKTTNGFSGLELLPGFRDNPKPKGITNVTMQVVADHHNNIKNAIIAIENFVGIQGTTDTKPFGPTLEGRINFLRRLVLVPRAWFSVDKTVGLVPFTVVFKNESFRTAQDGCAPPGPVLYEWDFGDNTGSVVSFITDEGEQSLLVQDITGGPISKTYHSPGIYDVRLTVTNAYGSDSVVLPGVVTARIAAPDPAVFRYTPLSGQIVTPGDPPDGPYRSPPVIRAGSGSIIGVELPPGVNPSTGRSYSGELLDGNGHAIDPITHYTWEAGDDLPHNNSPLTNLSFSLGGVYDLALRCDTTFGAYRISKWVGAIDIIEQTNLWLWLIGAGRQARAHEYGLTSETFKSKVGTAFPIIYDTSFLDPSARNYDQQVYEFTHNNGFTARGSTASGSAGTCLVFWASGRQPTDPPSAEKVTFMEYQGFGDVYTQRLQVSRPWNWCALTSPSNTYLILGSTGQGTMADTSPTNQTVDTVNLVTETSSSFTLATANYLNGATDLLSNPAQYEDGEPLDGHMSVYRSAWKGRSGYFVRNDNVGDFYKLRSFYRTEGTGGAEFVNIRKLPDMGGMVKVEGQLVPLNTGLYFFNNSGAVSAYNDVSGVWVTNQASLNSASFRALQDTSLIGYDRPQNSLLATSDGDHRAYLSFDYSPNVFLKFSDATMTFSTLGSRPQGEQWLMGIY